MMDDHANLDLRKRIEAIAGDAEQQACQWYGSMPAARELALAYHWNHVAAIHAEYAARLRRVLAETRETSGDTAPAAGRR
jgi:hypothetical protein